MNILFEMTNPRKFSEKIALHSQKLAQETAAFEEIMREVGSAVVYNEPPPSSSMIEYPQTGPRRHLSGQHQQHQQQHQQQQQQRHQRHRSMSHSITDHCRDVTLTSQNVYAGTASGYHSVSNGLDDEGGGSGDQRNSMVGPQRSGRTAGKQRRETSPYSSQLLSPPSVHLASPDSSSTAIGWRRTASDSALNRTVQMCDISPHAPQFVLPVSVPTHAGAAGVSDCRDARSTISRVYPAASYRSHHAEHIVGNGSAAAGVGVGDCQDARSTISCVYPAASYRAHHTDHIAGNMNGAHSSNSSSTPVDFHQRDSIWCHQHGSSPETSTDGGVGDCAIPTVVPNWSFSPPVPHHQQHPMSPGSPVPLHHQQQQHPMSPGSPVPLHHQQQQHPMSPGSPVSLHQHHHISSGSRTPSTPNTGECLSPSPVHYNAHLMGDVPVTVAGSLPDLTEIGTVFPAPISASVPGTGCAPAAAMGFPSTPLPDTDSTGTSSPPVPPHTLYSAQSSPAPTSNHLSVPRYTYQQPCVQQNWDVLASDVNQMQRQCQLSPCSSPVFDQGGFRSGSPHGVLCSRSPSPVASPQATAGDSACSPTAQQLTLEQLQLQRQFELFNMGVYNGIASCTGTGTATGANVIPRAETVSSAKSVATPSIPEITLSDFSTSEATVNCAGIGAGLRCASNTPACGEDPFRDTDLGELDLDGLCMLNNCEPQLIDSISEDCFRVESMTP